MRNSVMLPVMGVLVVIAGAVGLQLGESAVAQIDPVHFQGASPKLRDVRSDPLPAPAPAYASGYSWDEGYDAMARDCGDCPAREARHVYAAVPPIGDPAIEGAYDEAPEFDVAAVDEQAERYAVDWSRVSRYVHYPISADQAEIAESVRVERERPAPSDHETSGL
jgi:hypothetical protein